MSMTDLEYGKRVREREEFNREATRKVVGKDKQTHCMTIKRKSAKGVTMFSDITKRMSAAKLVFIRQRAQRTAKEAIQRQWILSNPFTVVRKLIVDN